MSGNGPSVVTTHNPGVKPTVSYEREWAFDTAEEATVFAHDLLRRKVVEWKAYGWNTGAWSSLAVLLNIPPSVVQ